MTTLAIGSSSAGFWSIINNKNYISVPGCTLYSINKKKSRTNCNTITFTEIKKKINKNIKNILLVYGISDLFLAYLMNVTNTDTYVKKIINEFIIFKNKLAKLNKNLLFLDILPLRDKQSCKLVIKEIYKNVPYTDKRFNLWYKNVHIIRNKLMGNIKKHIKVISINKELSMLNNNKFWLGRIINYPDYHIKYDIIALLLKKYKLYTPIEENKIIVNKFIKYDNDFYKRRKILKYKYKYKYKQPIYNSRKKLFKQLNNILKKY